MMIDPLVAILDDFVFIFILRNPREVLRSQYLLGWEADTDEILQQMKEFDLAVPVRPSWVKAESLSRLGRLALRWYVHNYLILAGNRTGVSIFYEHLAADNEQLTAVVEYAGLRPRSRALRRSLGRRSSSPPLVSSGDAAERLDPSFLDDTVEEYNDLFSFTGLYSPDGSPGPATPFDWQVATPT